METNSINSADQITQNSNQNITENNELDRDAFLKLLISQLKNQDPLNPMEDKEFIAEMAQFSSLEQMQNMNDNMKKFLQTRSLAEGASLIGKTVEKIDESGKADVIKGTVDKVTFEDGNTYVVLKDGTMLNSEDISSIY